MSLEVKIPSLGESISSGVLAKWHVAEGDVVKTGQALFELETDKITQEGTAEADGTISLKVAEGDEVKIGDVVAVIADGAAASAPAPEPIETPKSEIKSSESPAVRRLASETGIDPSTVKGSGKDGRVTKGDMLTAAHPAEIPNPKTQI